MCLHEKKNCPRCNALFDCKPDNIVQCQCCPVQLTDEQRAYIEQRYSGCLCRACLEHLASELHFFKERYIFR